MDELKLPNDTKLAGKMIEGHVRNEQTKIDRGSIGRLLGSKGSVPVNIAAIIGLSAAISLIAAVFKWSGTEILTYKDGISSLTGLVTLTLGYLFGRASKD